MADASKTLQIIISARDEATKTIKNMSSSLGDLAKDARAGSAVIVGALGLTARSTFNLARDFEQSRVAFEGFLGSADKAGKLLSDLSDFATKTPFDLPQVVEGAQGLLAYGVEAEKVVDTFRKLGDLSQGNSVRLGNLTLAYGQVRAATVLTGAEMRQFTENGVPLLEALAKQFNTTEAQIKKMSQKGLISFEDVDKALNNLTSEGGRYYQAMGRQATTMTGIISNTRDEFARFALDVMGFTKEGEIRKGSVFFYLKQGALEFQKTLVEVRPKITEFVDSILKNKNALLAIFGGLLGLLTPLAIAFAGLISPALVFVALGALIGYAIGKIVDIIPYLIEGFNNFKNSIQSAFENVKQKIDVFQLRIQELPAVVAGVVGELINSVVKFFLEDLPFAIGYAIGWIYVNIPILINNIVDWFNSLPVKLLTIMTAVTLTIIGKFTEAWNWVNSNVSKWPSNIEGFLKSLPSKIDEILKKVKESFVKWLDEAWNKVVSFKNNVIDALNAIIDTIGRVIDAFKRGFAAGIGSPIQSHQHGGFVDAGFGEAVPAILHGGERVIPRSGTDVNGGGGGGINVSINFTGAVNMDNRGRVNELADEIIRILGRQNELALKGVAI